MLCQYCRMSLLFSHSWTLVLVPFGSPLDTSHTIQYERQCQVEAAGNQPRLVLYIRVSADTCGHMQCGVRLTEAPASLVGSPQKCVALLRSPRKDQSDPRRRHPGSAARPLFQGLPFLTPARRQVNRSWNVQDYVNGTWEPFVNHCVYHRNRARR